MSKKKKGHQLILVYKNVEPPPHRYGLVFLYESDRREANVYV